MIERKKKKIKILLYTPNEFYIYMKEQFPNVIVIVLDTMRYDEAIKYKNELAGKGFFTVNNVYSTSPWTAPSHASILSGFYPLQHGVHPTRDKSRSNYVLTKKLIPFLLPSILKSKCNYYTYLSSANPYITPYFGYSFFDHFFEMKKHPRFKGILNLTELDVIYSKGSKGANKLMKLFIILNNLFKMHEYKLIFKWFLHMLLNIYHNIYYEIYNIISDYPKDKGIKNYLKGVIKREYKKPFFELINLMEVHEPMSNKNDYRKNVALNRKNGYINKECCKFWVKKYTEFSSYLMKSIIRYIDILESKGVLNNSLIITTSDHGQLFGEHDRLGHGIYLYDELLKIPFIVHQPKGWNVYNKYEAKKSLINFKNFILESIDDKSIDLSVLNKDVIISESYGLTLKIEAKNVDEEMNLYKLNKYRIRIQHKNIDGIFNVSDNAFENLDLNNIYKDRDSEIHKIIWKFLSNIKKSI